jgi:hypothetical protein
VTCEVKGFKLDKFTLGYIECALWSSEFSDDSGGEPLGKNYDPEDLAQETLGKMASNCKQFQAKHWEDLGNAREPDCNGRDFWLTRNRHGAGFWDRGLGEVGDRLTKAAHAFGEVDLYVGDDGLIYQTP